MKVQALSLEKLGYGEAIALFDCEFKKLVQNVADPEANEGKRIITLQVEVVPNAASDRCVVKARCILKLAAQRPLETTLHITREGEELVVSEEKRQESLPFTE